MLDAGRIVSLINSLGYKTYKFDYSIYRAYIWNCYMWYMGFDPMFHKYKFFNNIKDISLEKPRLNMAKRVCEDLTSLTVNENMSFQIEDEKVREFLLGNNEMTGVLGTNNFWSLSAKNYELVCALGTGAYEIVVEDLLNMNGQLVTCENSKIKIITHNAMNIIPLSWDANGTITEVAFVDQYKEKEDIYVSMRLHILDENKQYKIVNKKLKVFGYNNINKYVYLDNESVLNEFDTNSNIPWFSVLKLPIINNFYISSPMGASIYANAIDVLKNLDDAFNILCHEYSTGTKKIFYHKNLLERDKNGKVKSPDDMNKSVFYYMGDDMSGDTDVAGKYVYEVIPKLRIDEITKGIESSLNYLSVMCGLGNSYYKFTAGAVQKTATEVISDNSSMYRNIHKNQLEVEKCMLDLFKSLIYVSNYIFKTDMNIDAKIKVVFDASIIEDKVAIRNRDLQEVQLGIMSIEEYRAKYYDSDRRDS